MSERILERSLKFLILLLALILLVILVIPFTAEAQTAIYRSFQSGNTAVIADLSANAMTISGSTATFASALPDTVGVGDAIQYDSSNAGSVNAIAFIHGRTNNKTYTVKRFNGGTPASCTADTDGDIYRAYTVLGAAGLQFGDENDGINNTVENFDKHTDGVNIDARGEIWYIAFYAGKESVTNGINWDDWNTSSTERLVLFSPCSKTEVGTSQRNLTTQLTARSYWHSATTAGWSFNDDAGTRVTQHVDIIGLQFQVSGTGATIALNFKTLDEACDINITDCLIVGSDSVSTVGTTHIGIYVVNGTSGGVVRVRNSVIYGFKTAGATTNEAGIWSNLAASTGLSIYINNTTVYKCENGFRRVNVGNTFTVKNSITNRCADGFNGGIGGNNNVSDISSDCGSCTAAITGTVSFTSQSTGDFSLQSGDTVAKNAGADLSADANAPLTTDYRNYTRTGTFDCGAWEQGAAASGCSAEVDAATDNPTLRRRRAIIQ